MSIVIVYLSRILRWLYQIKSTVWPHAPAARILFLRNKSRGWSLSFSPLLSPSSSQSAPLFAFALIRYVRDEKCKRKKNTKKDQTRASKPLFFLIDASQNAKSDQSSTSTMRQRRWYAHALRGNTRMHTLPRIVRRWIDPNKSFYMR